MGKLAGEGWCIRLQEAVPAEYRISPARVVSKEDNSWEKAIGRAGGPYTNSHRRSL